MLDKEAESVIEELADEMYEAYVVDQAIRYYEGGVVRSVPVGAPPEYITVEIEGIYDENVTWRGGLGGLAVTDEVLVWENPITHRREIVGGSGATATTVGVHDHSSAAEGGTHWGGITQTWGGGSGANIMTVPDNVAQALNVVDAGGLEYQRFVTTNGAEAVVFDSAAAGVVLGFRTVTVPHAGVGAAMLALEGTDSSTAGPHVQFTTPSDDYPLFQILPYTHDSVNLLFDCYYDGQFKSSDPGSSFRIAKVADTFRIRYDTVAAGNVITWNDAIVVDVNGQVGIGLTAPQGRLHGFDTHGGFLYWEGDVDGAAEVEIIPNAAGDVERAVWVVANAWANAAAAGGQVHTFMVTPAAGNVESTIYVDGVPNELRLRLYSTGQLVVRRHAGADTYDVVLWLAWQ